MSRLALAAAAVAGLTAGMLGHAAMSRSAARSPADRAAPATPAVAACAESPGRTDLAALRGELARWIDERLPARSSAPQPAKPPDEPAPEAVAAVATAGQLIDAALARGSWEPVDRQTFHAALGAMDDAQRGAAISRLLTALNEGHLRAEVIGPVL